jgi:hypothetical protein
MLTTTASVVAPKILKELIAAGSVSAARVEPGDKGLLIVVRAGMNEASAGCGPRWPPGTSRVSDGAASVLQSYGITKFDVNTEHWVPHDDGAGLQASPGVVGCRRVIRDDSAKERADQTAKTDDQKQSPLWRAGFA